MGYADRLDDGSYKGEILYGPHALTIKGRDFYDLARNGLTLYKENFENTDDC